MSSPYFFTLLAAVYLAHDPLLPVWARRAIGLTLLVVAFLRCRTPLF